MITFSLQSGSNGNSIYVEAGGMRLLFDAGAWRYVADARRLLGGVIVLRSVTWFTLLAFVPLWLTAHGHSKETGNRVLFLMLFAGAVGTLLLAPVAVKLGIDRVKSRSARSFSRISRPRGAHSHRREGTLQRLALQEVGAGNKRTTTLDW